ncbi:HEPN domain-containing protein [Flavobacterium sp.]|uniref:HEPN domain-containing protein n=1 Tax=Flavobacterium sp. TaxID=239 RepID=UPI00261AAA07|nr:HEPN domain-containing protein [Flavobacterium sp.]
MENLSYGKGSHKLAFFCGVSSDLSNLNFDNLDLKFLNIDSPELLELIYSQFKNPSDVLKEFIRFKIKVGAYGNDLQVLIPKKFDAPRNEQDYFLVRDILKVIFPSDVDIRFFSFYNYENEKLVWNYGAEYQFKQTYANTNYIKLPKFENEYLKFYKDVNQLINIYLKNINQLTYIHSTINAYVGSYLQNSKAMEFVCLCIALESLVEGNQELNYRIRRNVAVLIGSNVDTSRTISNNVNYLYDLRSRIVHSGIYSDEKIDEYLPYLRNLVSVTILELFKHSIPTLTELNLTLTEKGFGDYKSLSENYVENYTSSVRSDVLNTKLKKIK